MKKIDKFMLKSYFGPMILTFFIVMFVLMMNFLWRYIDELVGKGLGMGVISELMFYAFISSMPMGLPLATLFAGIMTMGNMGENYELLAMKSSGMSLPRIMRPLIIVICVIAVLSFFLSNNTVPWATQQMSALIYDIRHKKQDIEFKDGQLFNGIDNMTIRVIAQNPHTRLLTGVQIYDNRSTDNSMSTTIADSGYMRLTEDSKYLHIILYHGERFQQTRGRQWFEDNQLTRQYFERQEMMLSLVGFDFERSDANIFGNSSQAKNLKEIEQGIDSLNTLVSQATSESYQPFLESMFSWDETIYEDSLRNSGAHYKPVVVMDSISRLDLRAMQKLLSTAAGSARNASYNFTSVEETAKESLDQLYRYKTDWQSKWTLPVSIMIFFLIGAPLGAIIRRGGLGMPVVISVLFFVIYYMINMTGQKLAREGSWSSFSGMWLSTFILLPLSVFLVYKATNDSNLFNAEWYIVRYKKVKDYLVTRFKSIKDKNVK